MAAGLMDWLLSWEELVAMMDADQPAKEHGPYRNRRRSFKPGQEPKSSLVTDASGRMIGYGFRNPWTANDQGAFSWIGRA